LLERRKGALTTSVKNARRNEDRRQWLVNQASRLSASETRQWARAWFTGTAEFSAYRYTRSLITSLYDRDE
jgi:hypothetical protein